MSLPALVGVLGVRLEALAEHLPAALEGDVTGVHQARVASRRLREAVPVAGAALGPARVRKAARRLRRVTTWLGPVRELDVTLGLIARLVAQRPDLADALEVVRARVAGARELHRARLVSRLDAEAVKQLIARMERVAARATAAADQDAWRISLARRVETRAGVLRRCVEEAGLLYDSHRLHEVRIAAKKLRYALELAGESHLATTARLQSRLKRVQDTLGDLHDLEILDAFAQAASAMPDTEAERDTLAALRGHLQAECRRLHAKFLGARSKLVAVADQARDRVALRVVVPVDPATAAQSAGGEGP